jgi:hypothetical protein
MSLKILTIEKFFLILFTLLSGPVYPDRLPDGFDWSGYNQSKVNQLIQVEQRDKRYNEYLHMQLSKQSLINGNLAMAKFHLTKVSNDENTLYRIKLRYLALISFIEGEFDTSLKYLNNPLLSGDIKYYARVCSLKMAIHLAKADSKAFRKDQAICNELNSRYGKNDFVWTETLSLILLGFENILDKGIIRSLRRVYGTIEYIQVWMKLALFVNQEDIIIDTIDELPIRTYQSKKIRELIAFAFYRKQNYEKAQAFIEDINTPNADNIRGNIMLKDNKLELAYGHFQLALSKRENSVNALERSIPLSWKLKQWEKGFNFTQRLFKKNQDQNKKDALLAAFQIQKDDFKGAGKKLEKLNKTYINFPPRKIQLMNSYNSLRQQDMNSLLFYSKVACNKGDGTNCWIYQQLLRWENLGQTIERDEKVITKDFSVDQLKSKPKIKPLSESIIIDQSDIEEIDSQDTKLNF